MQTSALKVSRGSCNEGAVLNCPATSSAVNRSIPASTHVPVPFHQTIRCPAVRDGHLLIGRSSVLVNHTDDRGDHFAPHCSVDCWCSGVKTSWFYEQPITIINCHLCMVKKCAWTRSAWQSLSMIHDSFIANNKISKTFIRGTFCS